MRHFIWLLLLLPLAPSLAQTSDSSNLYRRAQELAVEKKYDLSREMLQSLLKLEPANREALLLLNRTWLWEGQFATGIQMADSLYRTDTTWMEAFWVLADGLFWREDFSRLLALAPQAHWSRADSLQLMWYQARAYHAQKAFEQSLSLTQELLNAGALFTGLRTLHVANLQQSRRRHVQLDYQFSSFDAAIPNWHWLSFEYGQKLLTGPLLLRATYVERFNLSSTQFEGEWYPRLNAKTYAYAGLGVGRGVLFPSFRTGAELFRDLPHAFEISAGWRYIHFADSRIHSFTAAVGKYAGRYWIGIRPFVIPTAGNVYLTNTLQIRRYLGADQRWVNVTYGIGNSPDLDFRLNSPDAAPSNQLFLLAATLLRVDVQWQLGQQWLIKPFVEYKNEEFLPGNFRTRFSTGSTLLFQFR